VRCWPRWPSRGRNEPGSERSRGRGDARRARCEPPAIAFACELEALAAGAARGRLFQLAGRIGLSADATRLVLDQYELRAKLLHQAYTQRRRTT
jgi:hypothetical protein